MADNATCVFCQIVAGRIPAEVVFGDTDHVAFFPLEHINPGHKVLIPRRHTDYLFDLDTSAYEALWAKVAKLAPGVQAATHARRVGIAVEGFGVPHVHVHLVPLYAGDELNPTRAKPVEPAELKRLGVALREAFSA